MPAQAATNASYRVRLEGRAEKLEIARIRLTALNHLLAAFRWRSRLRENTALLRETAASQGAVEEALLMVRRRGEAESWSSSAAVVLCAAEVEKLSNRVAALALRRLGPAAKLEDLAQRRERLELLVLAAPRLVLPGQRWKTAQEVLPLALPDVQRAARLIAALELLFKRPLESAQRLPFTAEELDRLTELWPEGIEARDALWVRVARIDQEFSSADSHPVPR